MSLSLITLPALIGLSLEPDWLEQDTFPIEPLVGRYQVVDIYPSPLSLRHREVKIPDPLLHLHQRVSIEHVGEGRYYMEPAERYRFIFYGLPLSAAGDNAGLPPPVWQRSPQATYTTTADVIGEVDPQPHLYAQYGLRPNRMVYIAAFGQPGPEARLFFTEDGDLMWLIYVDIVPELQRDSTSTTIAFRLRREA
ncbi:MAG: hypothetical protein MEQ07_08995 [Aquimonas sp.]|nr:hypothetical protein [Aquimonas sp.]